MARTGKSRHPVPPTADISPRLVNRRGAASYYSVSVPYIDALRAQGILRPVPLPDARGGGQLRIPLYDVRDLDALIERCKAGGVQ